MYTKEDWKKDGVFSAKPGQEISREILDDMENALPPIRAGKCARQNAEALGIRPVAGFLMGEPYDCTEEGNLYMFFLTDAAGRAYYGGLATRN